MSIATESMDTQYADESKETSPFPLETRILKGGVSGDEQEFKVLVLNKPELWKPATTYKFLYELRFLNTRNSISFPLRAVSYQEWEDIVSKYPTPEWKQDYPEPAAGDPEFQQAKEDSRKSREVVLLEKVTGQDIPGSNLQEKIAWMERLGSGETENLFYRILEHNSNLTDGPLVQSYRQLLAQENVNSVSFSSFQDWLSVSEQGTVFIMQRPHEDFIVEIPLRQISEGRRKEIDTICRQPTPPSRPGKNPLTGKPDPLYPQYNYDDPRYKETVRLINRKKMVMLFDALLPFEIPGSTIEAKWQWLGDRVLGDVQRLWIHITQNVLSYRNQFDFFTNG